MRALFYKDKIVLLDENENIFLVRVKANKMYLDHYRKKKETIHKIVHEDYDLDFDATYDYLGNKIVVYVNTDNQLILTDLNKEDKESIILENLSNRIYYLNIIASDVLNIFYVEETGRLNNLNIIHLMIEGDKVSRNVINSTLNHEIIRPIQVREYDGNLIVFYYFKNIICMKMFNRDLGEWEKSITLTDNREKLYLDTKLVSNQVHLAYSINKDNQFYINYEKFSIEDEYIAKEKEVKISGMGNHTEPILIRQKGRLYIIWKETNTLYSCYSEDNGKTWVNPKGFPKVKALDMVKYKYLSKSNLQSREIDNVYGSTDPIQFIGF